MPASKPAARKSKKHDRAVRAVLIELLIEVYRDKTVESMLDFVLECKSGGISADAMIGQLTVRKAATKT